MKFQRLFQRRLSLRSGFKIKMKHYVDEQFRENLPCDRGMQVVDEDRLRLPLGGRGWKALGELLPVATIGIAEKFLMTKL